MKRHTLWMTLWMACGAPPQANLTVLFPVDQIGDGILHGAIFADGNCANLPQPINLNAALVRVSHSASFDSENKHPMRLSGIPAGPNRMLVAVVEQDGDQVCRACADGITVEDDSITPVTLTLANCP
jgi:hypothetical protein